MADQLEDDYIATNEEALSNFGSDADSTDLPAWDEDLDGDVDVRDPNPVAGYKRKAGSDDDDDDAEDEEGNEGVGKQQANGSKGKAPVAGGAGQARDTSGMTAEEKKRDKKRRNKEKFKEKKKLRLAAADALPSVVASGSSCSGLDAAEQPMTGESSLALLETLRSSQRAALPGLSDLEWEDRRLPSSSLLTPCPTGPVTLASVFAFLPVPVPTMPPSEPGRPHVLILASSGQRCADLVRELRQLVPGAADGGSAAAKKGKGKGKAVGRSSSAGSGEIAKLFAKHFKLSEHITYLANTHVSLAVGTPHRVGELLLSQSLKPPKYVLLDMTYRDAKKRALLEVAEVRDEVWRAVFRPGEGGLLDRLREDGDVRLGAF